MTGAERLLRVPEIWSYMSWSASVFCAVDGCNHLNCHGGPFRVALVGTDFWKPTIAAVYSSETDAWSDPTYIGPPNFIFMPRTPSVLVGNTLYVLCGRNSILEFDMARMRLARIPTPFMHNMDWGETCLVTADGGGLGFAAIEGQSRLHLWSKEEATDRWNHSAVKDLETLLPRHAISSSIELIGFANSVRVIVVKTLAGVFTVELGSSERAKMVTTRSEIVAAFPFMSFCTPGGMILQFAVNRQAQPDNSGAEEFSLDDLEGEKCSDLRRKEPLTFSAVQRSERFSTGAESVPAACCCVVTYHILFFFFPNLNEIDRLLQPTRQKAAGSVFFSIWMHEILSL
uniref:Uncharacterized protein n=1 Tax=Oryza brachyantha TaxID=4533 RepID=J3MCX4_ORYBR